MCQRCCTVPGLCRPCCCLPPLRGEGGKFVNRYRAQLTLGIGVALYAFLYGSVLDWSKRAPGEDCFAMRVSEFASFFLVVVFTIFAALFLMAWWYLRWWMRSKVRTELIKDDWNPPAAIHYIFLCVIAAGIVCTVMYLGVVIVVLSRLEGCSLDGEGQRPLVTHITLFLFPLFAILLMVGLEAQYTAFLLEPDVHRSLFISNRIDVQLGQSSYVLSDDDPDAQEYVLRNGVVRYNLVKHQYRLMRAAIPLLALYALVAIFHAEDPRKNTGVCEEKGRLRAEFGRDVGVSVQSTAATPRRTVDPMENRQLFVQFTVPCHALRKAKNATRLAWEVCGNRASGSVRANRTVELLPLPDDVGARRGLVLGLGVMLLLSILIFQLTLPPIDFMFHIFRYGYVPYDAHRDPDAREQGDRSRKLASAGALFHTRRVLPYTLPRVVSMPC